MSVQAAHEHEIERLEAYLDDELSPSQRGAVEAHLALCADCRRRREELEALSELLRAWPVERRARPPRRLIAELRRPAPRPAVGFGLQQALGWAWRAAPAVLLLALVFIQAVSVVESALTAIPGAEQAVLKGASLSGFAPGAAGLADHAIVGLGVDVIGLFLPLAWGSLTGLAATAAIGLLYVGWLASWWASEK